MQTELRAWIRHQGAWFLWKLSVEGNLVKGTWQTGDGPGLSWPMQSPGWTLRELRVTPDEITEIWDRTINPAETQHNMQE